MPIEFRCTQCRYLLRTPDQSAGKQARCPQCGQIQTIPAEAGGRSDAFVDRQDAAATTPGPGSSAENHPFAGPTTPAGPSPFADPFRPAASSANPYAAPVTTGAASQRWPPRTRLLGPAVGMIVVAASSSLILALGISAGVVAVMDAGAEADDIGAFVVLGVSLGVQLIMLWGAINMLRMKGYAIAIAGAVLAVAPCSICWCLQVPMGAWALAVLMNDEVRNAFA